MSAIDCRSTVELLPWFVRGSLGGPEKAQVESHLRDCPHCRQELEESRRMDWITSRHPSAELLADYAAGLEIAAADRRPLEQHLADCPTCVEEVSPALVAANDPSRPAADAARTAAGRWRALALAASLVAAIATASLFAPRLEPPVPRIESDVALVELLPVSDRLRASGEPATPLDLGRPATLVLVTDRLVGTGEHRLLVRRADDTVVATITGLHADDTGAFVLHLPAGAWPAGTVRLDLVEATAVESEPLESFRLRVVELAGKGASR